MHQDFLLTESVVPVIISINRKNRKEILRKKEIRLKKLGIIGYGLRSETMMKAFQGIQAPVQVAAVADPLWCQKQEAFAQTAEFAQTVFYETAEEMLEKGDHSGSDRYCSLPGFSLCRKKKLSQL